VIVAIDYDGTIADTNAEKVKWIRDNLGRDIDGWVCNRTECVPLVGEGEYNRMGDFVYERESSLQAPEVPGATAALRELAVQHELHVLSARTPERLAFSREWLEQRGVLSLFAAIHTSRGTTKSDVCRRIGAGALIDDDARHLAKVDVPGLERVLLQAGRVDPPARGKGVAFFNGWGQVVAHIAGLDAC